MWYTFREVSAAFVPRGHLFHMARKLFKHRKTSAGIGKEQNSAIRMDNSGFGAQ